MRDLAQQSSRSASRAALALLLILPAPTVGVLCAMYWLPDTALGKGLYYAAKAWLLALPIVWLLFVDRGRIVIPRFHWRGMLAGLITGLATLGVIIGAWELFAHRMVDVEDFREQMHTVGLGKPEYFLGFAAYITFINALLEEYVWRWFVYTKWRDTLSGISEWWGGRPACRSSEDRNISPRDSVATTGGTPIPPKPRKNPAKAIVIPGAIALAGLFFVLHHAVAMNVYFGWPAVALASLGIFIGHTVWSVIYLKYKNIYAAYLSHIFADIGVFVVGYQIAFG